MSWLKSWLIISTAQAAWTPGLSIGENNGYTGFTDYFTDLIKLAVIIGGTVSVAIVIYAGIIYSKSQGKPEEINKAKELVAGSLTGIAILLLIRLVTPTLGISTQ